MRHGGPARSNGTANIRRRFKPAASKSPSLILKRKMPVAVAAVLRGQSTRRIAEDNAADDFILITADSDFVPPVRLVQRRHPDKRLVVAAPPGRFSYGRSLQQQANSYFAITKGRIRQSLLGKNVMDGSGNVVAVRPRAYEPPP
ncbi:hypothetical protein A6K26_006570 [Gammaproteobacteria bacterium 2W06]|nr:hypothetical protein A6K26_006570 [Gammaproteobacteria bacterium 2W06]